MACSHAFTHDNTFHDAHQDSTNMRMSGLSITQLLWPASSCLSASSFKTYVHRAKCFPTTSHVPLLHLTPVFHLMKWWSSARTSFKSQQSVRTSSYCSLLEMSYRRLTSLMSSISVLAFSNHLSSPSTADRVCTGENLRSSGSRSFCRVLLTSMGWQRVGICCVIRFGSDCENSRFCDSLSNTAC